MILRQANNLSCWKFPGNVHCLKLTMPRATSIKLLLSNSTDSRCRLKSCFSNIFRTKEPSKGIFISQRTLPYLNFPCTSAIMKERWLLLLSWSTTSCSSSETRKRNSTRPCAQSSRSRLFSQWSQTYISMPVQLIWPFLLTGRGRWSIKPTCHCAISQLSKWWYFRTTWSCFLNP